MRRFHSYGPVNCKHHFCVPRQELVEQCTQQLIGHPEEGGHYFTIWAPRQTGKTWLMRQVAQKIQAEHGEQFMVGKLSMQGTVIKDDDPEELFLQKVPYLLYEGFKVKDVAIPDNWETFQLFFDKDKENQFFPRPLILFIDEFDSLPRHVIDRLVSLFRDMYLKRDSYLLHGLALIGVRAVLGVESQRGSPFNIQRARHVPNLTFDEVQDLYQQYQNESRQAIVSEVVEAVYTATNGQPGLVSWFGELLTEKYNPGQEHALNMAVWEEVYESACYSEFNNTVLNLIKKAKTVYRHHVLELFARSDVRFSLDADWCNYMYLHGLIDQEKVTSASGQLMTICRFSSPFIQHRVYNALTYDLFDEPSPILALDPLDNLADVFEGPALSDSEGNILNLPALLKRYKEYLARLKTKGINPWKEQPRRKTDLHLREAVGHFHLYAWLKEAVANSCVVSPEFPTGNGQVDLHLRCEEKKGIIEVKSFRNAVTLKKDKAQAAGYAKSLGFKTVTLATFVPVEDETVLKKLSDEETIDGVKVNVVAIGWV